MHRLSSERGAVLMHVILATILLIGVNVFVVDYGVMWVGRNQAQNAADAGAFAGAIALAYDSNDRKVGGPAKVFAWQTSQQNWVWGQAPKVNITNDITFPLVPADPCADNTCVRVDVYRDTAGGNPLPSLFGSAVGVTGSGVKAMAIAKWGAANTTNCLKPWAIPDKWQDNYDTTKPIDTAWTDDDTFDTVDGNRNPVPNPDVYVAPTKDSPGTGYTLAADLGVKETLKTQNPKDALAPGVFAPIQLPMVGPPVRLATGAKDYEDNIAGCNGVPITIDDPNGVRLDISPELDAKNGNMVGPTQKGVKRLTDLDPKAKWDPKTNRVINSCAQTGTCVPSSAVSPRIVAIPVFDTGAYYAGKTTGNVTFKIVNILGFFVEGMQGNDVVGYLTSVPGLFTAGGPTINTQSGFAKVIMLVR